MIKRLVVTAVAIGLIPALALAISIPVTGGDLVGSRSTPFSSGVYAEGGIGGLGWSQDNGGFKLAWNISFNAGDSDWDYSYTISNATGGALSKGLSHWILQVSDVIPGDGDLDDFIYDLNTSIDDPDTYSATSDGNSNPNMPGEIYGLKFDGGGLGGPLTFTFSSTQMPVWGDFYAKDGTDKPTGPDGNDFRIDVTAWNTGLDPANGFTLDDTTTNFTPWIPTPDTDILPPDEIIPEPMTMSLLGLGLLGLIAKRKRRKA
jgi:hypothetical protein